MKKSVERIICDKVNTDCYGNKPTPCENEALGFCALCGDDICSYHSTVWSTAHPNYDGCDLPLCPDCAKKLLDAKPNSEREEQAG